ISPLGLLDDHEGINDAGGGVPYVVARCALTNFAGVLDRRVAGRTLTFDNSGALWRDMVVLRDRETGTYWAPAPRPRGAPLTLLPDAVLTTANAWQELVPETLCLDTGEMSSVSIQLKM